MPFGVAGELFVSVAAEEDIDVLPEPGVKVAAAFGVNVLIDRGVSMPAELRVGVLFSTRLVPVCLSSRPSVLPFSRILLVSALVSAPHTAGTFCSFSQLPSDELAR